jgi:hypothetical protein
MSEGHQGGRHVAASTTPCARGTQQERTAWAPLTKGNLLEKVSHSFCDRPSVGMLC